MRASHRRRLEGALGLPAAIIDNSMLDLLPTTSGATPFHFSTVLRSTNLGFFSSASPHVDTNQKSVKKYHTPEKPVCSESHTGAELSYVGINTKHFGFRESAQN
jgi:hypothetical protein